MFPVSWPVSVVLAAILSIIHFSFRIVLNSGNFPELFIQTVSGYGMDMETSHTYIHSLSRSVSASALCTFEIEMIAMLTEYISLITLAHR